jgi:non-specific serine/threonine protein kinase
LVRRALALALTSRRTGRDCWFVDLAAVGSGSAVTTEVARTLAINAAEEDAAQDALLTYVGDRDALLVLDNCEHVLDSAAQVTAVLLRGCPALRVVATSREPLAVDGEVVWTVDPLGADAAIRLFVERARQRRAGYVPGPDEDAVIAQLCERLDRLPLAIELAAARVGSMSPAEILASIEDRRVELAGARRDAPQRHRSVRALVGWSYELLNEVERAAFRRLAVFAGTFDAAAFAAVNGDSSLDVLARLVDKSLVTVAAARKGATRYRLLETVREHAAELLAEAGEVEDARTRHLEHFATVGTAAEEGWWFPSPRTIALEADYGNVRAAVEWAIEADPDRGMRLLARTFHLFMVYGHGDGARFGALLLDRSATRDRFRVIVQITAGQFATLQGGSGGLGYLRDAQADAAALGERGLEAWAVVFEGMTELFTGEREAARAHLEEALRLHRELGQRVGEARALGLLALLRAPGDLEGARALIHDALALAVAEDDVWGQGHCYAYLGLFAADEGDAATATAHLRTAVELLLPLRDSVLIPVALLAQARVLVTTDPVRAVEVGAALCAIRARIGGELTPLWKARVERLREVATEAVGAELAGAAWRRGSQLGADEAIARAFDTARTPELTPVAGVSARELEVAHLVADGLTNKEIGARLYLSVRTVESHVRNLLIKLGLTNRTQLATWARDRA